MCSGIRSGRVLMIWPTLMKVAPRLRNRSATTRPNQALRRSRPANVAISQSQPGRPAHELLQQQQDR